MRSPRSVLSVLLAAGLLASLAGCASDDDSDPADVTTEPTTAAPTPSPTTDAPSTPSPTEDGGGDEEGDAPNTPPTGTMTPDVTEGVAPLNVTFLFEGDDGDGDMLAWAADFDGDDEPDGLGEVPGEYTFTYDTPGTYEVLGIVTDGEDYVELTATITVLEAEEAGPLFTFSTEYVAGSPAQGCSIILFTIGPLGGVGYGTIEMPPEAYEQNYKAVFTSTAPHAGVTVGFTGGGVVTTDQTTAPGGGSEVSGTVMKDAETMVLASCGGGVVTVDVEITAA